jgi:hypothetical protein
MESIYCSLVKNTSEGGGGLDDFISPQCLSPRGRCGKSEFKVSSNHWEKITAASSACAKYHATRDTAEN